MVATLIAVGWSVSVFGLGLLLPALFVAGAFLVRFDGRLAAAASIYGLLRAIALLSFTSFAENELLRNEVMIAAGGTIAIALALGLAATHYTREIVRS